MIQIHRKNMSYAGVEKVAAFGGREDIHVLVFLERI